MKKSMILFVALVAVCNFGCAGFGVGKSDCDCSDRGYGCPEGFGCQPRGNVCQCVELPKFKPMPLPDQKDRR